MGDKKDSCYKGVSNIDVNNLNVTTIINKYKALFEVTNTNVSVSNLFTSKEYVVGSCYTTVSNLSRILTLFTKEPYVLIIYTLVNLDYVYLNMLLKILRLDLIKLTRALHILEREMIITSLKRNGKTVKFLEHFSYQRTVTRYHLDKIIFYTLNDTYKPFFVELMQLWEKELPDFIIESVSNYKSELRKTRKEIESRRKINSKREKQFLIESKKILEKDRNFLEGRVKMYNNNFGMNITKEDFKSKLKLLKNVPRKD